MMNLTTGPVKILDNVIEALNSPIISHRSEQFFQIFNQVTRKLCNQVQVKETFLLTGSGTLANDAMLIQIKAQNEKGLLLVNGEFGRRLKEQSSRLNIDFVSIEKNWGQAFSLQEIKSAIAVNNAKWILLCHCETSTGQINDIKEIIEIGTQSNTKIYLDCMSTFGTMPLNLSKIAMATASTAKAIGTVSGLSMVFSNIALLPDNTCPIYIDLNHYKACNGIPFTISSNLVMGLLAALDINRQSYAWTNFKSNASLIYNRLSPLGIIPFSNPNTLIFTLVFKDKSATALGFELAEKGFYTSYQSGYLKQRNWLQIAFFSTYEKSEVLKFIDIIEQFIEH